MWEFRVHVTAAGQPGYVYGSAKFYGVAGAPEAMTGWARDNGEQVLANLHDEMVSDGWQLDNQGPFWFNQTYTRDLARR